MVQGAGILVGECFQFKYLLHTLLLAHGLQFINWPNQLGVESFMKTHYLEISTTNWIQLYEACITEEDGLKLVKVDTMGPHCDTLILPRSGAVLFSKANVKGKGKGKGKSQEVSWVHDETSSQADQGSPHAHPHSCCKQDNVVDSTKIQLHIKTRPGQIGTSSLVSTGAMGVGKEVRSINSETSKMVTSDLAPGWCWQSGKMKNSLEDDWGGY